METTEAALLEGMPWDLLSTRARTICWLIAYPVSLGLAHGESGSVREARQLGLWPASRNCGRSWPSCFLAREDDFVSAGEGARLARRGSELA
jgi:hypothetical protein